MATRGLIGVVLPTGEVKANFLHFDAHPNTLIPLLNEHYTDPDVLESLLTYPMVSIHKNGTPEYYEDGYFTSPDLSSDAEAFFRENLDDHGFGSIYGDEYRYLFDPSTEEWRFQDNSKIPVDHP